MPKEPLLSSGLCCTGDLWTRICERRSSAFFITVTYTTFTVQSAFSSSVQPVICDLSQWLCLGTAEFWEVLLFWMWGEARCWDAAIQHLHQSWTPAQKGQVFSLKNSKLGPGAWREERIDFFSWSVICCNHIYQGGTVSGRVKILPHSITKLRTKAPRKTTGVVGVARRKAAWAGKLPSRLFDTCCAQGNKILYVYWLYYIFINYMKKTLVSVLRSPLNWNNLQGLRVLSHCLNPKWGQIFGLVDLMGFILQCRSKRNAMKVKVH